MDATAGDVTQLLREINGGNPTSEPELFALIYQDLHRLAASYMRRERPDHTLQATALVNEAYLRLFNGEPFHWENRKQLFGTMAHIMRNLLVDHARKTRAGKRGGAQQKLSLDEALVASGDHAVEMLALNEALEELGRLNERQVKVVELRFFAGLTVDEAAAMLDVSAETVKLDWRFAKAWLSQRLIRLNSMDTREAAERHRRLQELFLQATQTIEAERCAFLDKACAGDPVMRREIERLLAADRETGGLLDGPAFGYRGQWAQECPQCLTCFDAGPQQCSLDGTTLQPAFEGPLLIDGRYRIEKRLGSGGMGAVYRALHIGLDKRFAVKMIRAGPMLSEAMRERFRHEGKALGRLKHPHIVDVTDAGVDCSIGPGGRPYLVMELLEGSTLQAALKSEGTLPVPRALPILHAVADAMDFAHRHQIIHGDIKPANVLLTADGRVKILDFGVAELLDSGSGPRPVMGTPAYMTAAVLGGAAITRSADHHALAVLTYELLTGEVPFGSKSADVVARQKLPVRLLSAMHPALPLELDAPAAAGFQRTFDSALDFIAPLEAAWHRVCVRQWLRREIPARSALAAVLALLLLLPAGWLAATSGFQIMEARTRDLRFRLRPDRAPDPRIVLVSIDDAALGADATPLIARADPAGEQLQRVFAGQPEALGIDLLLPVQWSHSRAFQELILQHARNLRLALLSTPQGETSGVECISPMVAGALGHDAIDRLFAFVNFEVDPDGAARWARYSYRDRSGAQRPSLAAAVTGRNQTPDEKFWLDQSIRWQDLPRISWKDLGRTDPAQFGGRLVFVGAEFAGSGDDAHAVPQRGARRSEISGLALHALMAATMLEGSPIGELGPGGTLLRRWLLLGVSLALFLCAPRMAAGAGVVAGVVLLSVAMDLFVFRFRALFFPMAVDYAMLSAGLVVAWWLRNRRPAFPALATSRGAKRGV